MYICIHLISFDVSCLLQKKACVNNSYMDGYTLIIACMTWEGIYACAKD